MAKRNGFTLIEFLLALTIIVIISAVSVSYAREGGSRATLRAASRELTIDLRFASERAATEQVNHAVIINALSDGYDLVRLTSPQVVIAHKNFPKGITLDSTTLPSSTAEFNTIGAAVNAGTMTLRNRAGNTAVLDIRPSGYVKIL